TNINDFITYNLDIREFVKDILDITDDHTFILHFYKALQHVSILDPTCGSGAFLFAAMNILEPLYETCISRMQEFHEKNPLLFKPELEEISNKYRSNIQYFIFKSIILRNLYGVDIMVEATEIAKLRLFLKMVAVVEVDMRADNLGLDPLPDIDFNIRCGNTLVGYATEAELQKDLTFGDFYAKQEFEDKVNTQMEIVATAFNRFKEVQFRQSEDMAAFKKAKSELTKRLTTLNDLLNKHMYTTIANSYNYEAWLKSHQPFHWLAEFYEIIHDNGGFDVIIGNPPYVEYKKKNKETGKSIFDEYEVRNLKTLSCGNLYAFVLERSIKISLPNKYFGMIVPTSSICTERMEPLQKKILGYGLYISTFGFRPAKLFDGDNSANIHLSIILLNSKDNNIYTTNHIKWNASFRDYLFSTKLAYSPDVRQLLCKYNKFIRSKSKIENSVLDKIYSINKIENYLERSNNNVYYRTTGGLHYRVFTIFPTYSKKEAILSFSTKKNAKLVFCLYCSNMWNMFYYSVSNCLDVSKYEIYDFPFDLNSISNELKQNLINISDSLNKDIQSNSFISIRNYKNVGPVECYQVNMKLSKPIIDEIDKVLAKHYGFTDEELDFIINYDIKYRMGDELNEGE
ncbi:MAG: DNA methyltransferase, partial [Agathobacter sp.]|nr:DNA methyltransferase [Agathobacter sp.]